MKGQWFSPGEYTQLAIFALASNVIYKLESSTAIAFLAGAYHQPVSWFGMYATQANLRTTNAAHTDGQASALSVAFFGGSLG